MFLREILLVTGQAFVITEMISQILLGICLILYTSGDETDQSKKTHEMDYGRKHTLKSTLWDEF